MRGCAVLVAAILLMTAVSARAEKFALLIGAGAYPDLPAEVQLKAPANDVQLMRQVLVRRGFDASRIEILSDGADSTRLPTRANILDALGTLATRVRRGDIVHLHFSGHGSLQPGPAGGALWQPIFLPRDARGWDGKGQTKVVNAITDTEMREAIDRINSAGAFVFAVFDACHSARLVRGALPGTDATQLRVRQVAPDKLGLSDALPVAQQPRWNTPSRGDDDAAKRGHAVYFYAAQSYELAIALPLASGNRSEWHGLFTWNLARALTVGQPMTYRQLGQHLLSRYDQQAVASATPLFAGDGLDDPVHGQQAPLVLQWPVRSGQAGLKLQAGALDGLAEGALLVLLADPLAPAVAASIQPPQGALGFVRLTSLEADRAALVPVAWQGFAAPLVTQLPAGTWARLVVNPPSYSMSVAIDSSGCAASCVAGRALAQLKRDGVPGVDVHWLESPEGADVRLRASARAVQLLLAGTTNMDRSAWGYTAPSGDDSVSREVLAQQTAGALNRIAKSRNLLKLASQLALRGRAPGLQVELAVMHRGNPTENAVTSERLVDLVPGDELRLGGVNGAADPLDMVAFWLGADQSIRRIYPEDRRDASRLAHGDRIRRSGWAIVPDSDGIERLLVISVPMRRGREAADFRALEQPALGRLRGEVDPDLQALFDACFADYRARGDAAPAIAPDQMSLQVFTFRIASPH